MKSIIIYFSRTGQNYVNKEIRDLKVGNTDIAAHLLQKQTGSDLFELKPVKPYSNDYRECVKEAVADMKSGARPELAAYPENMEEYVPALL